LSEPDFSDPHTDSPPSGNRDEFYLTHMLESIESILRYSASGSIDSDELTQDAVLRKLQLLTESSKRISAACKAGHPEVPWRELAGFRNVVVHDYLGIRVDRITLIVAKDVPALKGQIEAIILAIGGTVMRPAQITNLPHISCTTQASWLIVI
jgi:uncharacterized protein with HEPN domain